MMDARQYDVVKLMRSRRTVPPCPAISFSLARVRARTGFAPKRNFRCIVRLHCMPTFVLAHLLAVLVDLEGGHGGNAREGGQVLVLVHVALFVVVVESEW